MIELYISGYITLGILTCWMFRKKFHRHPMPLGEWILIIVFWPVLVGIAIVHALRYWKV